MTTRKRNRSTVTCCTALHMEWDRITCPICMEQPHNAVLLICSSYENGCRCYICNTSHRHSNCLDRFRKMNGGSKVRASHSAFSVLSNSDNRTVQPRAHYGMISRPSRSPRSTGRFDHRGSYSYNVSSGQNTASFSQPRNENHHGDSASSALAMGEGSITMEECDGVTQGSNSLKCPFCRGTVSGWIPAEELRQYLDQKLRTCSHDTCKFVGNYEQLREHARSVHTLMRPVHVDQARQRAWNRLEREWEHGDVISAIRTEMPGAMVVGDYVIETPDTFTQDFVESDEEGWSPAEDPVGSPDDRHGTPGLWPNFRQGSSSTGPDERQGPPSFLPQNRPEPSRLRLDDRRSSPTVLQDRRPSRNYSQWRQINVGRRSRYLRQWHQNPSYQPYAGSRGGTGLIREIYDRALVPRRRQRLRYTSRARYHQ